MSGFTVNPHRSDPYKSFKFRVVLDGEPVVGVNRVSALRRTTAVVLYREGNFPNHFQKGPGTTDYAPIVLERGLTHDPTFENWARLSADLRGDPEISLRDLRKDMRIDLLNEQGSVAFSYMVYRCWVSEYVAVPELDASANSVAIETIVLEHEGWERDTSVSEPEET